MKCEITFCAEKRMMVKKYGQLKAQIKQKRKVLDKQEQQKNVKRLKKI